MAAELNLEGCETPGLARRALFGGSVVPPVVLANFDLVTAQASSLHASRLRAKRGQFKEIQEFLLKNSSSQGQNLALTVLFVPNLIDSGPHVSLTVQMRSRSTPLIIAEAIARALTSERLTFDGFATCLPPLFYACVCRS